MQVRRSLQLKTEYVRQRALSATAASALLIVISLPAGRLLAVGRR